MRGTSFLVSPIRDHAFFEQAVFQGEVGHQDLHVPHLTAKILHLAAGCRPSRIPGQALLPRLQELLRPAVIQALGNAFPPAELGDAVLAAEPLQHDTDLLLGRMVLPGGPADVLHNLLGRHRPRLGFLSHLRFS